MYSLFDSFWINYLTLNHHPFHYLRFEKDSRYYELRLTQDLFKEYIIMSTNGRIKSKLGQTRTKAYSSFDEALKGLYIAIHLRIVRNYQLVNYLIEDCIYEHLAKHIIQINAAHQKPLSRLDNKPKNSVNLSQKKENKGSLNQLNLLSL